MTPQQQAIIIAQSAQGASCRTISDMTGIPKSTVNDNQQSLRPLIMAEGAALLTEGLPHARRTTVYNASRGHAIDATIDERKLAQVASNTILQAAQITQAPSNNTIINALIQINQDPDHAAATNLLADYLSSQYNGHTSYVSPLGHNNTVMDVTPVNHNTTDVDSEEITPVPQSHTPVDCILSIVDNSVTQSDMVIVDSPVDNSGMLITQPPITKGRKRKGAR
jgi:hypothetical protein